MPRILRTILLLFSITFGLGACGHLPKEESAVEAASPEGPTPTLYSRLGGEETLRKFSDTFIQQLALSNKLMSNPQIAGAMSKSQRDHKEKLMTLLCQASGGPCKFQTHHLKTVHAPLKISEAEWKEMSRIFIRVLQTMKVQKRERQELARIVAKYKNQIVGT